MYRGQFGRRIAALPRGAKKLLFVCFDVLALIAVLWLSFSFRLNHFFVPNLEQALLMLAAPAIALPVFIRMGLYRSVLRYLPERAIWTILSAVTVATLVWVSLAFLTQMTGLAGVPRSVALFYWLLGGAVIVGSRFGAKWLFWAHPAPPAAAPRTLIYGTGNPAMQLVNALISSGERNVIGFVSDDASLKGMDLLGLRVYPMSGLEAIVTNFGIDEVIVTTPLPTGAVQRELVSRFSSLPIKFRILPAIADLAAGKYSIGDVRDIDIDDLLRRSPVPADRELMRSVIDGRVILITGAAGSIGSALSRTVAQLSPEKLILMDFNEHGLYEIGRDIAGNADFPVVRVLGSVADAALARQIICENGVETIYHCAAFKHVAMVEANCIEGARNNVLGTWTIVEAAYECSVSELHPDLFRQGGAAQQRDGRDEAMVRAHRALLRHAPRQPRHRAQLRVGPFRQRHRLERLRRPALQGTDRGRRPGDADARGHDPLFHVGAGGGGADHPGDRALEIRRRAPARDGRAHQDQGAGRSR